MAKALWRREKSGEPSSRLRPRKEATCPGKQPPLPAPECAGGTHGERVGPRPVRKLGEHVGGAQRAKTPSAMERTAATVCEVTPSRQRKQRRVSEERGFVRGPGSLGARGEGRVGIEVALLEAGRILKYLIIYLKCETAGVSKGTLLEGQLVISIEAFNSKHQANVLHCVITIASAKSKYGDLVFKEFLKEIQSLLLRLSAKLTWTSEAASHFPDTPREALFQMTFEVDEKPRILMMDSLIIKDFLHKISVVHPKIRCNFSIKVNGSLSEENFGVEDETILKLPNGIALTTNYQHYVSGPELGAAEFLCSKIHPVPGRPVTLSIPADVAGMGLFGELILTPAAALCPCPKVFSKQASRISSISVFLYGPSGLPLMLTGRAQPMTVFTDVSCLIDWKKHNLCVVPNVDFNLDQDVVLPDVCYQIESCEGALPQGVDPKEQTLLLFFFVDFHCGFPAQRTELQGAHTLLATHLHTILLENQHVLRDSIQTSVDQALEKCRQVAQTQQRLQASHAVAVSAIMGVVMGSTSSSFRRMCFQALQAADTQEFGIKLHKAFNKIAHHRILQDCAGEVKQLPPKKNDVAPDTEEEEDTQSVHPEDLPEARGPAESKRRRTDTGDPRASRCRPEPVARGPSDQETGAGRERTPGGAGPGRGLEVPGRSAGRVGGVAAPRVLTRPFPAGRAVAAGGRQPVRVADAGP
ncbi:PREDICTED: putative uncharacterized protein C11orf80 homolog [Elephantulus edwardii]|uniref:putative uncharacterized protein C11orf80 homolog n=1 Tax=Elephantulus edwardii TaxID=28737 RepID=UPI0003F061BF|nr:PREDICTED: putative uncharacterized protein C11orf80 homolog [Elephantulus edwardii]